MTGEWTVMYASDIVITKRSYATWREAMDTAWRWVGYGGDGRAKVRFRRVALDTVEVGA